MCPFFLLFSPLSFLVVALVLFILTSDDFYQKKRFFYFVASIGLALISLMLFLMRYEEGVFCQGFLHITALSLKFFCLFLCVVVLLLSIFLMVEKLRRRVSRVYLGFFLISVSGGLMTCFSAHFLLLFLSLELQILPLYILVVLRRTQAVFLESGIKYFLMGTLSTCLLLLGISLIYGACGTLQFEKISFVLQAYKQQMPLMPYMWLGVFLCLSALFFKLSLFPFHGWTPDVYQGAETHTVLILATLSKIIGGFVLLQIALVLFSDISVLIKSILQGAACASMFLGALGGLKQTSLKRLIAYSTISQMGYVLSGATVMAPSSLSSVYLYLAIYTPVSLLLLLSVIYCESHLNVDDLQLSHLKKIKTDCPLYALYMALCLLSLAGIPPLPGFFGKAYLLISLVQGSAWVSASALLISSLIACVYYLRVLKGLYLEDQDSALVGKTSSI